MNRKNGEERDGGQRDGQLYQEGMGKERDGGQRDGQLYQEGMGKERGEGDTDLTVLSVSAS